jgi:hypothetical protein
MANLSLYTRNKVVDWVNGKASMPSHVPTYIATFNGDPSGGGTETTFTICAARVNISSAMATSSGGAGSSTNSSDLTFTTSALGTAVVSYVAGYDASTSGNLLWFKSVTSTTVYTGNTFALLASTLVLSAGGALSGYSKDYLVNWMSGKEDFPATTTRYYSLWSSDPQGGSPVEVTSTIRSAGRIAFTSLMSSASGGAAGDTTAIDFGSAAASASIGWTGCSDASTSGNLICSRPITGVAQTVATGNPVRVPISSQVVSAA